MLYYKQSELAEVYHISHKTVANWIKEVQAGKLDLELHEANGRAWILKTTRNIALIEQLVEERRKFRNTRGAKTISPKPEFYELYNQKQIFDIAHNLDIYREIPLQYSYFDSGAESWDAYVQRLASEKVPNNLNATIELLNASQTYIDSLLARYKRVNIIDVGSGNALPAKGLIEHLLSRDKLGHYIALDISTSMLKIAKDNITKWFGANVVFEGHELDINYDRFIDKSADDHIGDDAADTANLILVFGGTFGNLRSSDGAIKVVHDSMYRNDLLIYSRKLDNEASRQYFDFGIGIKRPILDAQNKMIVDLMDIDESYYDVEMGFDDQRRERYIRIRLKLALTISLTFDKGDRIIEFNKNDTILLWRSWHQTASEIVEQLDRADMEVLQTCQTEAADHLFTISRVRCSR